MAGTGSPSRGRPSPLGASITLAQLDTDPHPILARLRRDEPVAWLPCLEGWLVTRHDLALEAMRDDRRFTVDDPRFSTAQVVGPSMLSLDGGAHAQHRAPFVGPFRAAAVSARFAQAAADRAAALLDTLAPLDGGELRRMFAGPMSASIVSVALGLGDGGIDEVLGWYDAIVASVTQITAGAGATGEGARAFAALRGRLLTVIAAADGPSLLAAAARDTSLSDDEIVANAAVLLFGGIETTEGMIANTLLSLLAHPSQIQRVRDDTVPLDAVIDESLRLEPAAAVVDRYATTDARLGTAAIASGDLVRISIAAANRDPSVFADPDRFDPSRPNLRRHLAFAQGPHVCVGVHLARLEARTAIRALVSRLPAIRLDPRRPPSVRGLVFRKPARLDALWEPA